jgi:hypothetical protein
MKLMKRLVQRYRERAEHDLERQHYKEEAREQCERLRAELSHLEQEIYALWESDLPRQQKDLLEQAIRVRCHQIEDKLLDLTMEASGFLPLPLT